MTVSPLRRLDDGRELLDSGSPWEARMGYSRAVRAGQFVLVAGCVGVLLDGTYPGDLAGQTARCVDRIEEALAPFGCTLKQVVRVRIYTTRIDRWEEIASVMGPRFAETRPANAMVEVSSLVDARALVEIEADAWAPSAERR